MATATTRTTRPTPPSGALRRSTPRPSVLTGVPAMLRSGTSLVLSATPVAGQKDMFTTGSGSVTGIPGGPITILSQFVLRAGNHFTFVWLNSAGPATEGIGSDPGL